MTATKQQLRIEAQIAKAEQANADRLARLKERLTKETTKTRVVSLEMTGIAELIAQVEAFASLNQVSNQRVLDFVSKQIVGATAKVMYRQPRVLKEPKAPREPKVKVVREKKVKTPKVAAAE